MYQDKKILAVITARSGSKRLLNKNILNLAGKPLIAWTIEAGKKSRYIDKLIVSTDTNEIKNVSQYYGAEVPFLRPTELSADNSDSVSVLKHAIDYTNENFDYILLLQPTSPLRSAEDIDKAIEMLNDNTQAVVSVCEAEHSLLWCNTLPGDFSMADFIKKDVKNKRSQDLPIFYRLNGAIYISEVDYFYEQNGFWGDRTKAYLMPRERSVDIDTWIDFKLAEAILQDENI